LLLAQIAGRVETINKPLKSIQTSLWLWPKIEHIFGLSLSLFLSQFLKYCTLLLYAYFSVCTVAGWDGSQWLWYYSKFFSNSRLKTFRGAKLQFQQSINGLFPVALTTR